MKILIDTHIWLWMLGEPEKLREEIVQIVVNPKNQIFVSIASYWELQIKVMLGHLTLPPNMIAASAEEGIQMVDVSAAQVDRLRDLPLFHKDPFDRILMATALQEQMYLLTVDRELAAYQSIDGLGFVSV